MPLDVGIIRAARPRSPIHYFTSIGSTMTEAARLASNGAEHGTLVIADQQTAGIGRLGRSWTSPPDEGIYCSILIHLDLPPAKLPISNLLLGLSVAEAIEDTVGLACDLRWPNDVLINDRKVCGILSQLVDSWIIAGIGINVNQTEFEPGLRTPATSLRLETGSYHSREKLVISLLDSIGAFCELLFREGTDSILRCFASASSYVSGRQVSVEDGDRHGVTAGLDENGFLKLRTPDGRMHHLSAGGVRAARS